MDRIFQSVEGYWRVVGNLLNRLPPVVAVGIVGGVVAGLVAFGAWLFKGLLWTGFGEQTLWNWMEIFVIPTIIGAGGYLYSRNRKEAEDHAEALRGYEAGMQSYLDRMSGLLLGNDLRESVPGDSVRDVARAHTLTALKSLDGLHKGLVVRFLYESRLITRDAMIISLEGMDLAGVELESADLHNANLRGIDATGANLAEADLSDAVLSHARLDGAVLRNVVR